MTEFNELYILVYSFMAITAFFFIKKSSPEKTNILFLLIFGTIWVLLFSFRDISVGSDTASYIHSFKRYSLHSGFIDSSAYKDFGYFIFLFITSNFTSDENYFLLLFECLIIIPLLFTFYLLDSKRAFLLFFLFCSFFFFKTMSINIMRQGVSISFFLLGLLYFFREQKKYYVPVFIVAALFHASILLPLLLLFFSTRLKSVKWPIFVYCGAIILAILNFDFKFLLKYVPLASLLFEERLRSYIEVNNAEYEVGFRLNFVVFNTIFALIGYYFYRLNVNRNFRHYNLVFFLYLLLSANFFLMFNLPYSDRSGLLSWVLIPIILYPFLNELKYGAIKLYLFSLVIFIFFQNL